MTETGTLLLPIAGRSSRFPGTRPKWMLTAPNGPLMLELALTPVPDWRRHRVVIGALREHLETLGGEGAIRRALGSHPEIVVFDDVTAGPAATVSAMISKMNVTGPIFIKDCDSWFSVNEPIFDNAICITDVRYTKNIKNIPGKSFVQLNENDIVLSIHEKIVCSNYISVGGYGFASAEKFLEAYTAIARDHTHSEPFVSHVVLERIRAGDVFRGISVSEYQDVGTLEAWQEFRAKSSTYIVDIDGVILRNAGAYIEPLWSDPDVPLAKNVETIRNIIKNGGQIVFMTARPEIYRRKTEDMLSSLGLTWKAIIFGMNHSKRYIINDFAASNPYPSAIAINLPRNDEDLERWLSF